MLTSYAEIEKRVAQQAWEWERYPRIRSSLDGLVHRTLRVHSIRHVVHDEVMHTQMPITGCGQRLPIPIVGEETAQQMGFCSEDVPLTCMRCASELPEDGDRERNVMKQALFGQLYGKTSTNVGAAIGRMSGKSYSLKKIAQQFLGPIRHRAPAAPSKRPGRWVRRMLARAVWALP